MSSRRPLIAGNWKMHAGPDAAATLAAMAEGLSAFGGILDTAICPPATLIAAAAKAAEGAPGVRIGAQDCHQNDSGAHTGCLSAAMLRDAGATMVILGHSERRTDQGEPNALVLAKTRAAARAGLLPIVCVGETRLEREAGRAEEVVGSQIRESLPEEAPPGLILAYEPVWAIGTGLTPTLAEIEAIHAVAREALAGRCGAATAAQTRILYGGSVKPENAREILALPGVDGALVGGASLKTDSFLAIVRAHPAVTGV